MKDLDGRTLKGYRLLEPVGSGPTGAVYRALQGSVGREVALKIIHPAVAGRPDFIRRFEREAQMVARLEHLHVVPLYDFWRDPTGAYLVSRWMRGGSLDRLLASGPLELPAAARMLDQIAAALDAAHLMRVLHQNLKPENVLFDEDDNAYLSDFGLSQIEPRALTTPEQARGETENSRSDIHALGVLLYQTLTARHPFADLTSIERLFKQINEPLPLIDSLDQPLGERINAVIQRATARDPAERYGDAAELAGAFRVAARLEPSGEGAVLEASLTAREEEILAHIVRGRTNQEIANALFVELSTVKWHITALYRKLGVRSRRQAIVRAREWRLAAARESVDSDVEIVRRPVSAPSGQALNPYKGLRPFEGADSRDFFGREATIERLLDRLRETASTRFLALLGPNGSGKSSLLGAGLIPAIRDGRLPGSERWFVVRMSPGSRPLDELEVALTRIAADQADNLHAHLTRDADGLLRAASLLLPADGSELLLVIDQFEELFALTPDGATRDRFLDQLYHTVTDPRGRVRVVIAMRADFYDRPLLHPGFGTLMGERIETLLPLSAAELERAIVRPAEQVGVAFEHGLPARIIEGMLYQPGALPLLQYALTELFEMREGRLLTARAYEEIGGAVGAIARRANEIYREFEPDAREMIRQLFLRLVNLGETSADGTHAPDTRRRVPRADLLELDGHAGMMDEIIDTFGDYRLLTLDHDTRSRQPTVELAHEALIGEWERLRGWLDASREDLHRYRAFRRLADEWEAADRASGFLLRDARLDLFAGWAAESDLALRPFERDFLAQSLAARDSRRSEEAARRRDELATARRLAESRRLRAEEQGRANRRLRGLSIALAVLLLLASAAALLARAESRRAADQARIATARELAAESLSTLRDDPELAIHLAIAAVETTQSRDLPVLPVAEAALHRALQGSRVIFTLPASGSVTFSPDGAHLVIGDAAGTVTRWDASSGGDPTILHRHDAPVLAVAYSPDGRRLASFDSDHRLVVQDRVTRRVILDVAGTRGRHESPGLASVSFSPDGRQVVTTAQDEDAALWDVATGRRVARFEALAGPTAAFSPGGRDLALMTAVWRLPPVRATEQGDDLQVIRWSERSFDYVDPFLELRAPSSEIESTFREPGAVSYNPDGTRLLTSVISTIAVVRDARSGAREFTLTGHAGVINDAVFDRSGTRIATGSADGTARLWDAQTGQPLLILDGHTDEVIEVGFSPDGRRLVTASLDGSTRVWDLTEGGRGEWEPPVSRSGWVLAFDPSSPRLLVSSPGESLQLVNLESGEIERLTGFASDRVTAAGFSPDGARLALGSSDGVIHLVEARTQRLLRRLDGGGTPRTLEFGPDGDYLCRGSEEGRLAIWTTTGGRLIGEWTVQGGFVNGLGCMRESTIVGAGADGTIFRADPDRLIAERAPRGAPLPVDAIDWVVEMEDVVTHLDIGPDGGTVLASSWDGTILLLDLENGSPLRRLEGHSGRVWQAVRTPDGERAASAGADGRVILWSLATGEPLLVLAQGPTEVRRLAISADGRYLATATSDHLLRVYILPIDQLLEVARQRATRALSADECRRYLRRDDC